MIDIDKKYRTRDGREVHIYATDCDNSGSVHGAIKGATGWNPGTWMRDGSWANFEGALDLIEVKPRIRRTLWINVYEREDRPSTKEEADSYAASNRIACAKVEIDVEEGEGL